MYPLKSPPQQNNQFYNLEVPSNLTHWGRKTHICVGKLNITGSDNCLSPGRHQAIIWTNDGIILIGPIGTYFSEILIGIQTFSLTKWWNHFNWTHRNIFQWNFNWNSNIFIDEIALKMSSVKWHSFCLGLNVLTRPQLSTHVNEFKPIYKLAT